MDIKATSDNSKTGCVFYDDACGLCRGWVQRWQNTAISRRFEFVPLQSAEAQRQLALAPGEIPAEIKVLTQNGQILGGVDGILHIARSVWWGRPLIILAKIPGMMLWLRPAYRWLAAHRRCFGGCCRLT